MIDSIYLFVPFWRHLCERLARQAAQTAVPILATVAASTGRVDLPAFFVILGGALVVTLGKTALLEVLAVEVTPGAPTWAVLLDRSVPAFAGVVLGCWPADATGLMYVDWVTVLQASSAAAVLAVIAAYATPPGTQRGFVSRAE